MELVRDKVPEILKRQGLNPEYREIASHDHNRYDVIRDKLVEVSGETAKAIKSGNPEEVLGNLASLLEIMGEAAKQYQITMVDVKAERDKKRKVKGGYKKFYVLLTPHKF